MQEGGRLNISWSQNAAPWYAWHDSPRAPIGSRSVWAGVAMRLCQMEKRSAAWAASDASSPSMTTSAVSQKSDQCSADASSDCAVAGLDRGLRTVEGSLEGTERNVVVVRRRHRHRGRDRDGIAGRHRPRLAVDAPRRGDHDVDPAFERRAASGGEAIFVRGADRAEVIAVEAPDLRVDPGVDGERHRMVSNDGDLLHHDVQVAHAREPTDRHRRVDLTRGPGRTMGELAGLEGELDLRILRRVEREGDAVDGHRDMESVGDRAELAPHAVGHVVGVRHDAADESIGTLVGTGATVAEVPVADHEVGPHGDASVIRRRVVDDLPTRVGAHVFADPHRGSLAPQARIESSPVRARSPAVSASPVAPGRGTVASCFLARCSA